MKKPRRLIASCIWLFVLPLAMPVQAAPFNPQLKAPRVNGQVLGEKAQQHFKAVEEANSKGEALIRDPSAYRRWVDLEFALGRAIDDGVSLSALEKHGLKRQENGTYVVDAKAFPQWDPLDSRLRLLTNPETLEGMVPALQARGFRPEDVETLREYLRTHLVDGLAFPEQKELVGSFAPRAAKASKAEVLDYVYQRQLIAKEAQRQWAVGLLNALDAHPRRALTSYLMEEMQSTRVFGPATRNVDALIRETVEPLISGEYRQQIQRREAELKRSGQ